MAYMQVALHYAISRVARWHALLRSSHGHAVNVRAMAAAMHMTGGSFNSCMRVCYVI